MEGYTKIGRIRPNYTGTWNAETAYTVLEMVKNEAGTASYIARQDVPAGTPLTDGAYWAMVLDAGDVIDAAEKAADRANKAADALGIVPTVTGSVIAINDASDMPLKGLKLFGKTTQDGTPTPETPVLLVSVGEAGSITTTIEGAETDAIQTLTAQTPNGLAGIPVSSGGNYTDENGQQWVCDEIDLARGVYIQRVRSRNLSGIGWSYNRTNTAGDCATFSATAFSDRLFFPTLSIMCDVLTVYHNKDGVQAGSINNAIALNHTDGYYQYGYVSINPNLLSAVTGAGLREWFANNDAHIIYAIKPIETALTAEEIAAFRALRTNKSNTTIYNDGGAGMEVKYVADTKAYIDNKFAALQEAIINA